MKDVNLVVGAGFSGAVIANLIADKLNEKVLVIDRKNHVAGNCYDYKDKNGIMILYFVENQRSNYYKSDRFKHILQQVTSHPERYTFKQFNNRLQVSVKRVADAKAGVEAVKFIM